MNFGTIYGSAPELLQGLEKCGPFIGLRIKDLVVLAHIETLAHTNADADFERSMSRSQQVSMTRPRLNRTAGSSGAAEIQGVCHNTIVIVSISFSNIPR